MILYYSKGGVIADLALIFNMFFIVGILAQLNAALTLPGIAGIVLNHWYGGGCERTDL